MHEIKRVEVLPAAIFGGLLSLVTSAVGEVLVVFPTFLGPLVGSFVRGVPFVGLPLLFGWFVLPILNGVLGFLMTGLCCLVYNAAAPKIGGIKVALG
jgi:hypothetical protein